MSGPMDDLMFDLQIAVDGAAKDAQEQRWNTDALEE